MADPVRILSIDGGGIRGIVPALVLAEIERRTGRRIAELFDLLAGTSTGGILSAALTTPLPGGTGAAWTAEELAQLYEVEGPRIFRRSPWRNVRTLGGLAEERYSAHDLDAVLRRYFGDARLSGSLERVLLTAYDIERRVPYFFKSWRASEDAGADFPTRLAVRATSSAPTYFEPLRLRNEATGITRALVDGGVFAANPAMCAYAEAVRLFPDRPIVLASLGTGELTRRIPYEEARDWGAVEWVRPLIGVIFDGVSDTVDYQLRQLVGGGYLRLQRRLEHASDDLDDASRTNMRGLRETAQELIAERTDAIDELCERLTA